MGRKSIIALVAIVTLAAIPAVAAATGEQSNLKFPPGTTAINPKTCKFIHKEVDPPTPPSGAALDSAVIAINDLRYYTLFEDARHDAKMNCNTNLITKIKGKAGKRGPAGPSGVAGYIQVTAHGTGATVTATCPMGDVVLGGGSPDEVTGSWPSSTSAWTVARDHLSPKTMTVIATCAEMAS